MAQYLVSKPGFTAAHVSTSFRRKDSEQKAHIMDKGQATGHEEVNHGFAQPKKTFASRLRRSCARFWWLYLLAFMIIVLVIVLPMYDCSFHELHSHKLTVMIF